MTYENWPEGGSIFVEWGRCFLIYGKYFIIKQPVLTDFSCFENKSLSQSFFPDPRIC
jgi:hypothetical protein